jgi:hypothetical protein
MPITRVGDIEIYFESNVFESHHGKKDAYTSI